MATRNIGHHSGKHQTDRCHRYPEEYNNKIVLSRQITSTMNRCRAPSIPRKKQHIIPGMTQIKGIPSYQRLAQGQESRLQIK
ncbi:MAG: hypothetical protein GY710_14530 [Desulfobacteraceae bacterium]|nr:hypothetical protein [Desulfobacteraceae bacterium]